MKIQILTAAMLLLVIAGCNKEIPEVTSISYQVSGKVQKGPYRQGGTITLFELDSQLVSTGINYSETIQNNAGSYLFNNVELKSSFAELKADGFYFNEMDGAVSTERLVLTAFADLANSEVVNVNVLTHLSSARTKYLIQEEGKTFGDARTQAANETLKAFNLESSISFNPELLDIANNGELDSKLLAVSAIVQANLNVASLSELLTSFAFDLETDGTIDGQDLQQNLITGAINSNFDMVSENLSEFFVFDSPESFKQYVNQFINETNFIPIITKKTYQVSGIVQKGPFRSGTTITLSELNSDLKPTGLNYFSTVTDNLGSFQIPDVKLESDFVEIMADGFYYNENFDFVTTGRLVLKTITNLADSSKVNVNIPTHISAARIKYLIQNQGMSFDEAKQQAQMELLKVFNLDTDKTSNFELVDIIQEGELNSKLFAISMIIQGVKNVSPLSEFLTLFSEDFKTNGAINDEEIQHNLMTNAILCNVGGIRANIMKTYKTDEFNDFQQYVSYFVNHSDFEPYLPMSIPTDVALGENLLALPDNTTLSTEKSHTIQLSGMNKLFGITILEEEGEGNVVYTENNLTNWDYDTDYGSNENGRLVPGILLNALTFEGSSYSATPLLLNFKGSGTIKLTVYVHDMEYLPDNGGLYAFVKYFNW